MQISSPKSNQLTHFANLQYIPKYNYFCTLIANRPHSSMDRISDSGSDDLGSNPDGVTLNINKRL